MKKEVVILIAEDDDGHADLITRNLQRAGVRNRLMRFRDGEAILNFLFNRGSGSHRDMEAAYLLLLDIRMPKVDGIEVLKELKKDDELRKIPVIMLTTTDDPKEIEKCHSLGCSNYITKPIEYDKFINIIKQLGLFMLIVEIPSVRESLAG